MSAPVLEKRRHDLRNAWVSLALAPLSLIVADGVLHGMLGLLGFDESSIEEPDLLQALIAGVPFAAVMLLPALGGFRFGTNAVRRGDARGRIPRVLGIVWGAVVLLGCTVFLVLVLSHGAGG